MFDILLIKFPPFSEKVIVDHREVLRQIWKPRHFGPTRCHIQVYKKHGQTSRTFEW